MKKPEEIPINIKGVPVKLHKKFKNKCLNAGVSMTKAQMDFMEMVGDGRSGLKRHEAPRMKREKLGGKTAVEITKEFNDKVRSLATTETVARAMARQYYIGMENETGITHVSAEESAASNWKQWIASAEEMLKDIFR